MSPFDSPGHGRVSRLIPLHCKVRIKSSHTGETHYGECAALSVDDMSLQTDYVPHFGERLQVVVLPPRVANLPYQPLEAEVEVQACSELVRGEVYEIGSRIVTRR